jgi:acetylornithine deacetylase/succinyl-diaminopimelate desuccinylase-like protein
MCSSGVWAGAIPLKIAHNLLSITDPKATQKSELQRINYLGTIPCSHAHNPIAAHFELHIEQGPILETNGAKIGAVTGAQAYKWFTITVKGRDCHTGTTDFANRSDALLTASKLIVHSHNRASELGCLASTGVLSLKPGSTNTVPGLVTFSLDIRSPEDIKVEELEKTLKKEFEAIATGEEIDGINAKGTKGRGCSVEWKLDSDTKATKFDDDCIRCVEDSAEALLGAKAGEQVKRMTSGAGHDRYALLSTSTTFQSSLI